MLRVSFLILFFVVTNLVFAQEKRVIEINNEVTLIDQETKEGGFKESSFEDDYGNETDIKAFFQDNELLKIEATSRSLKGRVVKNYYFSNAELILVDELTLEHPGLANWEEAKSNDLGYEEIERVQTVVTKERRFYLDDWKVIKALPVGEELRTGMGEKLNREAQELFRRLE